MHILEIQILSTDTDVINYYKTLETLESIDSGRDVIFPETMIINKTTLIKLGIKCQLACSNDCNGIHGYYLMPRSSIYKTPLRQSNNEGLIDCGYRGEICVPVDFRTNMTIEKQYEITKGQRLFQLVMPDAKPFKICIVNELTTTERGEGGFGSTSS